jgi:ribosomal protein S24E
MNTELVIENRIRNDLLRREEISAGVNSEITPKTEEVKNMLAEKLSKDAKLIVIKKIKGRFGSKDFLIEAYIYDNSKELKRFESLKGEEENKSIEEKAIEKQEGENKKDNSEELKEVKEVE